jgi:hypothetical protein
MDTSFARLQAAAQHDAQRFFGSPNPTATTPARRWRLSALYAGTLMLALAGAWATAAHRPATAPLPLPEANAQPHPAQLWAVVPEEAVTPAPVASQATPSAPAAQLDIQASAQGWQLALQHAPLRQAVARLSELSGTEVSGLEGLRDEAVSVHWQGHDLHAAWLALLGDGVGHAVQCREAGHCRVWIVAARR